MGTGPGPAKQAQVAQRREQAIRLRIAGHTWGQIATMIDGYSSPEHVMTDVSRALKERRAGRDEAVDELVDLEHARLEEALKVVHEVMGRKHWAQSGGTIVTRIVEYVRDADGNIRCDADGSPLAAVVEELEDDGPLLAAVDRVVKISESLRKLHGLDKPAKTEVSGNVHYSYGVDTAVIDQV